MTKYTKILFKTKYKNTTYKNIQHTKYTKILKNTTQNIYTIPKMPICTKIQNLQKNEIKTNIQKYKKQLRRKSFGIRNCPY